MILLFAIAAIAAPPAQSRSRATVQILRSRSVTPVDWENAPSHQKREVVIRDENGQPLRVRVIEHE